MLARNSAWVLPASARAALRWCDALVILDHASTDGTWSAAREVMEEHPGRVSLLHEANSCWDEMDHRQRTLDAARVMGATHVANVDDDEVLTANAEGLVKAASGALPPGESIELPWLSVWDGLDARRVDRSHWSSSQVHVVFALSDRTHYRRADDGYQHHARCPRGNDGTSRRPLKDHSQGGLLHLQFSSRRRLRAKQALYKMNEVLRWPGRMTVAEVNCLYDGTALAPGLALTEFPREWWPEGARERVDLEAEPWQEAEVKRLLALHGVEAFAGLDLYDVC
jgi:hypothetical protein